ncbi:hypothetical protein V1511DRAFT_502213 [Dipodascopsis uninucleata]
MEKPLNGFVLCCTGIESDLRSDIDAKSKSMGAIHRLDLMSDVTHMIAASVDTPKYRYVVSKRPDIIFLRPDFIPKLYRKWIEGEDFEIHAEIRDYGLLPVFNSLRICLSNIPVDIRQKYSRLIKDNGGEYMSSLSLSTNYLVVAAPKGEKYEYAIKNDIKIAHFTWLDACAKREAIVDPIDYSLDISEAERALNFEKVVRPFNNAILDSSRLSEQSSSGPAKSLKSSLSGKPAKPARLSRLQRKLSENTWNSIMESVAADSIVQDSNEVETEQQSIPPFDVVDENDIAPDTEESEPRHYSEDRLFQGHVFKLYGFEKDKEKLLSQFLKDRGAALVTENSAASPTHFLVYHKLAPCELPHISESVELVTEWYAEQSIYHHELRPPSICLYSSYLGKIIYSEQAKPFKGKKIPITGFSGANLLHIKKLIEALEATPDRCFSVESELLIVPHDLVLALENSGMSSIRMTDKIRFAKEFGIPIFSDQWLLQNPDWSEVESRLAIRQRIREPHEGRARKRRHTKSENLKSDPDRSSELKQKKNSKSEMIK